MILWRDNGQKWDARNNEIRMCLQKGDLPTMQVFRAVMGDF